MDRNSFSYVLLVTSALASFLHLSWMSYNGKFTFSLLGMIFMILYGLQTFMEYKPVHLEDVEDNELAPIPSDPDADANNQLNQTKQGSIAPSTEEDQAVTYVQYRQFSPSRHHHLSSHRFQMDSSQPNCDHLYNTKESKRISMKCTILEFCVFLLNTSFFTTDLFFAYQVFNTELNYIPLLGGLLNIIPALYMSNAERTHDLFIFTIPANCWGQIYYAGFKQNNVYAMLAGYLFFVAYYYNDMQRIFKGLAPQSQANYYMSTYCICASLALQTAFSKFNIKPGRR